MAGNSGTAHRATWPAAALMSSRLQVVPVSAMYSSLSEEGTYINRLVTTLLLMENMFERRTYIIDIGSDETLCDFNVFLLQVFFLLLLCSF